MWKAIKVKLKNTFTSYHGRSINNITVNYLFAPIYALIVHRILTVGYSMPSWDSRVPFSGAVPLTFYSTLFYCYCSAYFQPDLDQFDKRPGMNDFPFGGIIANRFRFGKFLKSISWPITKAWYYLWDPFGQLFTHRGVVHWPILGVWLRVGYLYGCYFVFEILMSRLGLYRPSMRVIEQWLLAFFPWSKSFATIGFYVFCLPVYLADMFHSAVDLFESYKKGTPFCSPQQKKGIIYKFLIEFKDVPVHAYRHFKDYMDE